MKKPKNKILKIGVVTAEFNSEVTSLLKQGALSYLKEKKVKVVTIDVPGAVEIPLATQALLTKAGCHGVVALGAVIRGDTSHYDYVCNSVERGITALMLETRKPIGFGVLTTENEQQAMDRAGGRHGNKGRDAAEVVVRMIETLAQIKK